MATDSIPVPRSDTDGDSDHTKEDVHFIDEPNLVHKLFTVVPRTAEEEAGARLQEWQDLATEAEWVPLTDDELRQI